MRSVGALILGIFLFVEVSFPQRVAAPQVNLANNDSQVLNNFKSTLAQNQWAAVKKLDTTKPAQNGVCPNCTTVDDGQLVAHALVSSEPGAGPQHILIPINETKRLDAINSNLWDILNALKGADKEYMNHYEAAEKATAPTTLEQIALRSAYIKDLVSRLAKSGGGGK
jgi:hypothetical protein